MITLNRYLAQQQQRTINPHPVLPMVMLPPAVPHHHTHHFHIAPTMGSFDSLLAQQPPVSFTNATTSTTSATSHLPPLASNDQSLNSLNSIPEKKSSSCCKPESKSSASSPRSSPSASPADPLKSKSNKRKSVTKRESNSSGVSASPARTNSKSASVGGSLNGKNSKVTSKQTTQPGAMIAVDEDGKPCQSYIGLIAQAILSSVNRQLVLSDIYAYIQKKYPYFKERIGWNNSIRHNLSLNDCFVKGDRAPNGKGHFWYIHPANLRDFMKGDFRRRRAQRKVRRCLGYGVLDAGLGDDDENDSEDEEMFQMMSQQFGPYRHHYAQLSMFNHQLKLNLQHIQNWQRQFGGIGAAALSAATGSTAIATNPFLSNNSNNMNNTVSVTARLSEPLIHNTANHSHSNKNHNLLMTSPNVPATVSPASTTLSCQHSNSHESPSQMPAEGSATLIKPATACLVPSVISNGSGNFTPDDYYTQYLQTLRKNWLLNQSADLNAVSLNARPSASSDDLDQLSSNGVASSTDEGGISRTIPPITKTSDTEDFQVDVDGDDVLLDTSPSTVESVSVGSGQKRPYDPSQLIYAPQNNQIVLNLNLFKQILVQKANSGESNESHTSSNVKRQKFDMDSLLDIENTRKS